MLKNSLLVNKTNVICKTCCFSIQLSSFLFHLKPKSPNFLLHSWFSTSPSPNLRWYHHQSQQALVLRQNWIVLYHGLIGRRCTFFMFNNGRNDSGLTTFPKGTVEEGSSFIVTRRLPWDSHRHRSQLSFYRWLAIRNHSPSSTSFVWVNSSLLLMC